MSLGIFMILLLVLLLIGARGKTKKEFFEDAFSLSVMKGLQGFCAAGIILHHLAQAITQNGKIDRGVLNLMCDIGVFFVGVFFFCSGYGVYTSLKTKQDYLKGFLPKRLSTILVPFYTGNTIFVLTAILFGETFTTTELISALTGWILLNTQLWFIVEIFILYIIFYILFKGLKNEKAAYLLMGVFIIALMIVSLFLGHDFQTKSGGAWLKGEWWYNCIFLFFIGMTFARYYDALIVNIKKIYWVWLSIGLIGSGVFYALTQHMLKTKGYWAEWDGHPGYLEKIQTLSCQLPMIIFMVVTFFLVTMKLQFKNNLLSFLGKIAFELYIIHNLFIINLRDQIKIKDDFIYIISVYVLSISLAVLLHAFDQKVIALILGKKPDGGSGEGIEEQKKTKLGSQREYFIDCMRLLMTFFVVFIHSPFGGKAGEVFFCFGKMAVPFFIVISGYFCFSDQTEIFKKRIKKQAERIFMLCVGANFLYVYLYLIGNKLGIISVGIYRKVDDTSLVNLLLYNQSPVADHLWFLGSLFYALVLMLVLTKLKFYKNILFFAPVFLSIYLYLSYYGGGDFIKYRNVFLVTLPYFMMGCLIRRYKQKIWEKIKPGILISAAAAFSVFVVAEYFMRKNTGVPYLSIEVLIYLVVLVCLYYPNVGSKGIVWWLGSRCTLYIYILHMGVLWFLWFVYTSFTKAHPPVVTITAFVLPLLFSVFIEKIKQHDFMKLA
ncbi:acyltransferase family protein [Kineothrix sp. MB12-C1]|uniref:acyltransferase family protein n=1 Tax=Kineothrix sp. MB12-C1 TaxID=3070215 RepID=UPI0027D2EA73|nr:acyltransferase [Kineothrix sp. MB12-C1]WMC93457.1 acyltransferase [Kineothrix sp. MB12-C1]